MNKQSSIFNLFLFGLILLTTIFSSFGTAKAQAVTPSPSPTAMPAAVVEAQPTAPENLSGVPSIAPNYESNERDFPELGRVGVDMMQQKPLTLREAITLALENN
nr:hypothetical protein [Acidobacteriota bacterium]